MSFCVLWKQSDQASQVAASVSIRPPLKPSFTPVQPSCRNSWPLWPKEKEDWALRERTKPFVLPHLPCKKLADCSNMPSALCFEPPIKKLSAHHCRRLLIFYLFIFFLSCCSSAPPLLSNLSRWWLCFRPLCALSRWRRGISTAAYWWPVVHFRLKPESKLMHLYIKVTSRFY